MFLSWLFDTSFGRRCGKVGALGSKIAVCTSFYATLGNYENCVQSFKYLGLSFSGLLDTCCGRMYVKFGNMASKITACARFYATLGIYG